ncbi:hypothetical protein HanRHA438_Chr15g0716461 [Helianthus annuus]|nr:hypothetical protein HanRHA438_Chr15g0716461 [Helianthus annuus]
MMFDTGALDHVNPDRGSLHSFSEYGGPDEIVLVNGKTLSITHTGHMTIPTSTCTLSLFFGFCIFVMFLRIFFSLYFFIKDLLTGRISYANQLQ